VFIGTEEGVIGAMVRYVDQFTHYVLRISLKSQKVQFIYRHPDIVEDPDKIGV